MQGVLIVTYSIWARLRQSAISFCVLCFQWALSPISIKVKWDKIEERNSCPREKSCYVRLWHPCCYTYREILHSYSITINQQHSKLNGRDCNGNCWASILINFASQSEHFGFFLLSEEFGQQSQRALKRKVSADNGIQAP